MYGFLANRNILPVTDMTKVMATDILVVVIFRVPLKSPIMISAQIGQTIS